MSNVKFWLITDTHFFKYSLGAYGPAYEDRMWTEQKCFAETEAICNSAFKYLEESKEADIVLVAGDLTFNGEKESHIGIKKLLDELAASGKKVYVVTASHDVQPKPICYPGTDEPQPCEGIKFDDLMDYYGQFGYSDAIAFDRKHMSYVAQIADGIRLLALCNDTAEGRGLEYDDELLGWIKEQLDKAKADGQLIFAMEHYPVIAGQPVLSLIGDARQKGAQKLINLLADNGCHLIFTGHMHNQSINEAKSENGNIFYDVCTGSLIGCPAFMRLCEITDDGNIDIKSVPVPDFEWDTKGMTCTEYLQAQFDSMILNLITGLRDNPQRTMRKIHIKDTPFLRKLLQKAGTALCEKTIGQCAKLFFVKAEDEIKDKPILPLLADIARYVFTGDQPYTDQTPEGRCLLAIFKKLSPLFKILGNKLHGSQGEQIDLYEMLRDSIGNYGINDANATLYIK